MYLVTDQRTPHPLTLLIESFITERLHEHFIFIYILNFQFHRIGAVTLCWLKARNGYTAFYQVVHRNDVYTSQRSSVQQTKDLFVPHEKFSKVNT